MWAEIPGATQGTIGAPHSLHVGTRASGTTPEPRATGLEGGDRNQPTLCPPQEFWDMRTAKA